ncbi:MAG: DHH family phosphoesterase, partial [Nanoarchaeota archaeon]
MLTDEQIMEVREHLERAQNPVFYYDNDADGLCSFALLRRFIDRGKGVAVRSFPDLNKSYARKALEFNSDYVFVVDKPFLSKEFLDEIKLLGLPVVWIDHHELPIQDYEKSNDNLFVYNPARNNGKDKSTEPVTYL